jgi:hypothetical protein
MFPLPPEIVVAPPTALIALTNVVNSVCAVVALPESSVPTNVPI